MNTECRNCAANIDMMKELYTVCEGRCARRFHASCVGVSEADLCALSKNIIWICDECMAEFCKARDAMSESPRSSSTSSIVVELDKLKSEVGRINDAIAEINDKMIAPDRILHHSTPDTTPMLSHNTNVRAYSSDSHRSCVVPDCEESFSIVLSNIDSSVTEYDIVRLVSRSLCASEPECLNVTKLVPSWKSCKNFDYISFKIVLNKRWKESAMNAKTWPSNVKIREYVN